MLTDTTITKVSAVQELITYIYITAWIAVSEKKVLFSLHTLIIQ